MKDRFLRMAHAPTWQLVLCILLPLVVSVALYQVKQGRFSYVHGVEQPPLKLEGLLWDVPHIRLDAQKSGYEIEGWVADRKDVGWLKPRLVLIPKSRVDGVEVRTTVVVRKDVSAHMADAREVHFGGFKAFLRAKDLPGAPGARIYLSIEREGRRILVDTQKNLPEATYVQPD